MLPVLLLVGDEMNRFTKKFTLTIITLTITALSVYSVFAETIYEYYGFKYTLINNFSVSIQGWDSKSNVLTLPNKIEDRSVTEINHRAFMGDNLIESINLSKAKSLSYIGMFAFKDCFNLNGSLTIPDTITKIETAAFENCKKLQSITFNARTESIPSQCFNGCELLSSVTINNSVKRIESYAFADCTNLKYIELSKNIESIAKSSFMNDEDLIIGCYKDSYSLEYAKSYNINYIILDPEKGDANSDGSVDVRDVTAIQKYKAGLTKLTRTGIRAADVTGDGEVSVRDATQIQRYLANIITGF